MGKKSETPSNKKPRWTKGSGKQLVVRTVGRPTGYKPEFCQTAAQAALAGATDMQLCDLLGIDLRTLYRWRLKYPEFGQAIKISKDLADDMVERSMFQAAIGYSHPAVKILVVDKQVQIIPYIEHHRPDAVAAIFWLKNRRSLTWRDRVPEREPDAAEQEKPIRSLAQRLKQALKEIDDLDNPIGADAAVDGAPAASSAGPPAPEPAPLQPGGGGPALGQDGTGEAEDRS